MADASLRAAELDLRGYDLSRLNLEKLCFRRVRFGTHPLESGGPDPAALAYTRFRQATFVNCDFSNADLTGTDLRGCRLEHCDLRFVRFRRTQLGDATFSDCDCYRATFAETTIMSKLRLERVSLDSANLDGALGLEWGQFAECGASAALVQESGADRYRSFLERTRRERLDSFSVEQAIECRLADAARVHRHLSGMWTTRGQYGYAGSAYARSRRLECAATRSPTRKLWLWSARLLCGFGVALWPVIFWLAVVALLPGFLYAIFGGVSGAHDLMDHLLFSASSLTASTPARLSTASSLVEWVRVAQTFAGVALLGLFGFVLANKIRNS